MQSRSDDEFCLIFVARKQGVCGVKKVRGSKIIRRVASLVDMRSLIFYRTWDKWQNSSPKSTKKILFWLGLGVRFGKVSVRHLEK